MLTQCFCRARVPIHHRRTLATVSFFSKLSIWSVDYHFIRTARKTSAVSISSGTKGTRGEMGLNIAHLSDINKFVGQPQLQQTTKSVQNQKPNFLPRQSSNIGFWNLSKNKLEPGVDWTLGNFRQLHLSTLLATDNDSKQSNSSAKQLPEKLSAKMAAPVAAITPDMVTNLRTAFVKDSKNRLAMQACTRMDPLEVCLTRSGVEEISHVFNHKVEQEGKPMTNQKSSGRCWIFALFNAIRVPFIKHYNLDEFEFSQSHLFFYDKLERCNYFLNNVVETYLRKEPVDGRLLAFLLLDPVSDGGQWDMLINLVARYGMMPKKNFPESFSSESTARMNSILRSKLREFCKDIREELESKGTANIDSIIRSQLSQIYKILAICLGVPREEFTWEYYDKSKAYHKVGPISPKDFYAQYVKPVFDMENKVCLINDPRPGNPYGKVYTVDLLGNMVDGRKTIYNNQPIELLMKVAAESVKNGEPVWFGCEVTKRFAAKQGVEDLRIHDYECVFGTEVSLNMTKAERLLYMEAAMTHAMVITAVSLNEDGQPTKWRVENSWGDDRGEKGYLLMTNDWFREFVFEVVVDKSLVPQDVLDVFSLKPIVLPAWDPMGTLACKDCDETKCGPD